jgi:monoamine oxidase
VTEVDVAVVGAGLSGLSAARAVRRRGASVVVLEARDRVGGKMHTVSVDGVPVDLGAHWVGPTQRRILALCDELGIERHGQHLEGEHLLTLGGERHAFTGVVPRMSAAAAADMLLALARIEVRRRLVRREDPWRSRGARRLDSFTVAHWMRGLRTDAARAFVTLTTRTVFGAEPAELSYLYFLWYTQMAGGIQQLTDFEGGAQDSHLAGGTQQVCERLADELGDAVELTSPVTRIGADGLVSTTRSRVHASRAIVAVSPAVAARIDFEPPLPPPREALAQRMPMGAYMKAVAVFDSPWWRERGLSGIAFDDSGPVQMVVDASPPGDGAGVLMGFITGAPALGLGSLAPDARREAALGAMAAMLAPEAAKPAAFRDFNWHEERWSRGGPVGLMGPGTLTALGPRLREPIRTLHWAGTDTATEWNGYMDGAIQAGERAAHEVTA